MNGTRERRLAAWLFAFALLVRVIVPQGYMLAPADDGLIRISVCTGYGAVEMGMDQEGRLVAIGDAPDHGKDKAKPDCPFAAALSPVLPNGSIPQFVGPRLSAAKLLPPATQVAPGRGLAAPPPPSTGPPALA